LAFPGSEAPLTAELVLRAKGLRLRRQPAVERAARIARAPARLRRALHPLHEIARLALCPEARLHRRDRVFSPFLEKTHPPVLYRRRMDTGLHETAEEAPHLPFELPLAGPS